MNIQEKDILLSIYSQGFKSQRALAEESGHSLGVVNRCLKSLTEQGLLLKGRELSGRALELLEDCRPRRAVILSAGYGMRMVPINTESPKALVKVRGEYLIERQIRQLHEAGIREIYVVVGFMKERFEYLIDDFGVELIVNSAYSLKNNLHSLCLASDKLLNAYVVPCDIWCRDNPFRKNELYSWYMVSRKSEDCGGIKVSRSMELIRPGKNEAGNLPVGIAYFCRQEGEALGRRLRELDGMREYDESFWEAAICSGDHMTVPARLCGEEDCIEINTYEQLRELDSSSEALNTGAICSVCRAMGVSREEISGISILKKGMTNRSFLFNVRGGKYIMRIPGEGTDRLINRRQEAAVYELIRGRGLCDELIFIDPDNGYKITRYIEGSRVCRSDSREDLQRCMALLRRFHAMDLKAEHSFDIFEKINFYESLRQGRPSVYRDYESTKEKVFSLRSYISSCAAPFCLTHIDAVPDNFLFSPGPGGEEELHLIDWEYSAMQDPHVDIAMFCIYALYSREQCDELIDIYFENRCPGSVRAKIYCYIAACGLLWSNWCEYKSSLGVEFGEYSLRQYRYAKEFYRWAGEEISKAEDRKDE